MNAPNERIALSITNADFGALAAEIARVRSEVDVLHLDIMDGHFVPNILMGPAVVNSLRKHTDLYFDCHLMITDPARYIESFKNAGADGCSVHVEANDVDVAVNLMRELNLDVGLGINPDTPLEAFEHLLDKIDMLLVMTVHPGFGGQKFIPNVMPKLRQAHQEIQRRELRVRIEVDGGVDATNALLSAEHGADTFVVGSAILGNEDPVAAAREIRAAIQSARQK